MEIAVITASVVAVVASVIVALQIVLEIKSWSRPLPPAIVRKVFPEGRSGDLEPTIYYSNNVPYLVEVTLTLEANDWYEFEGSELYRKLKEYLDNLKIQNNMN